MGLKNKYGNLKRSALVCAVLLTAFFSYVEIANRNSVNMTYRQKILKAVYPAFIWMMKITGKKTRSLSNEKASPAVSFYSLKGTLINGTSFDLAQL
jgi:glutathione peroxidase